MPFDPNAVSPDDFQRLQVASGQGAAPPPSGAAPPGSQVAPAVTAPFDPNAVSAQDFAQLQATPSQVGVPEAAGRTFLKHMTFGLAPQDRARLELAEKEHPWINAGTGAGAMLAQTALLGPLSAAARGVQGANLLAKGVRGAGTLIKAGMLPNLEARTALGVAGQGAKLGAVYSGLETAGSDLTDPNKTGLETARDVAASTVLGGVGGGALGIGAHGVGKLVGAAASRMYPGLAEARIYNAHPELMGVKSVADELARDRVTPEMLTELRARMADPANAARYSDLNLLEALQSGDLVADPVTGALKMPVRTNTNTEALAQDVANTISQGSNDAATRYAARKNAMPSAVMSDVDRVFGTGPNDVRTLPEEVVPGAVDQAFGTSNEEADKAALDQIKEAFGRRYRGIRTRGDDQYITQASRLHDLGQRIPALKTAINYAANNDLIRTLNGKAGATDFLRPWNLDDLKDGFVLSADNLLDIHHSLANQARVPFGQAATPADVNMGQLKNWFSNWVDNVYPKHEQLRTDYALFKKSLEAREMGEGLPINTGGAGHDSMQFLRQALDDRNKATQTLLEKMQAHAEGVERYNEHVRRGGQPGPGQRGIRGETRINPPRPNDFGVVTAQENEAAHNRVIENFRRGWAQQVVDGINSDPKNADGLVQKLLSPEGHNRIRLMLGDQNAAPFLDQLHALNARRIGRSLGLKAGDDDGRAMAYLQSLRDAGREDLADHFVRGWGESIKTQLSKATPGARTNSVVDSLLTPAGQERLRNVLGPGRAQDLITSLYNKDQQGQLSQKLWGNSNTAYKLARDKKFNYLGNMTWNLFHGRPMEAFRNAHEMMASNYAEQRANQVNQLLSRQGIPDVTNTIDAILGYTQRQLAGNPVRNPLLRAIGPIGATGTTTGLNALNGSGPYQQQGQADGGRVGWTWSPYQGSEQT